MLRGLLHFLSAFRKGEVVRNPESWKRGEVTAGVMVAVLVSIAAGAKAFGLDLGLSNEDLLDIAYGLIFFVGLFIPVATTVSTEKIGLPAKKPDVDDAITDERVQPVRNKDERRNRPMQGETSVNDGGKGLLGR